MIKRRNQDLFEEMAQPRIVPTVTKQPECLLEAMELISESANNSHLTDDYFKAVEIPTMYLSKRLQITPIQAVLFSLLIDHIDDSSIRLRDIADMTGCSTTRLLRFSKSLEELAEKFFLRIRKGSSHDSYRIPREVIMSLRDNVPYVYKTKDISNVNEFFDEYEQIFGERRCDEISYEMLRKLNEENLEQISNTHFAQTLKQELHRADDRLMFVHMAHLYISMMDEYISFQDIGHIYDDHVTPTNIKEDMRSQISALQQTLIENSNKDGMAQPDTFRLTSYAKNDVLKEVSMNEPTHTSQQLTRHETLTEKALVYNEKEGKQITELSSLLMPDRFKEIQNNLEKSGMRRGFCCLLYGAPGTGKTETVYQIARKTGRDILQVNINEIKSCWVGESEKNISNVFDRYRNLCQENKLAPILLFNEADAILGLRMDRAVRGVDKMENSIQNIILQEMETLDGVMIATTNLTSNLDKAFERRFLYKINFEKPTIEVRCRIWMQMLKGLNEVDATQLASRFDFSGGEIENIARKHTVSTILSGSSVIDMELLCRICEQERIESTNHRRVGF
ncbi:MAG: ATP-binding protein [Muribaculaceae bacterium]|nr:ATP-binding protein [Muribaculaceae bacterium]